MTGRERVLLSRRHPVFYFASVWEKRFRRYCVWLFGKEKFAREQKTQSLPFKIKKHQSVLIRKLGDSDVRLQQNKVVNLKIAAATIDGLLIRPGETFSFYRRVGLPTKRKGYLEGMELSLGQARPGIGGGLCQIANLLHWLVLHSPLTVTERHHHSFDPFPDDGRVLPFGSGATVFYNYLDYQFRNDTEATFQIRLWFSEKCLEGKLLSDREFDHVYHIFEKEHEFLKIGGEFYRKNEIWRKKCSKEGSGPVLETELVAKNFARVMYEPEWYRKADA